MASHLRVSPVQLTRLADKMLDDSQAIADTWRDAASRMAVPVEAFGDSSDGPGAHRSYQLTEADGEVAVGRLVAVLEGDTDRLYRVAFAYQREDDGAAGQYRQLAPGDELMKP